ncbi:hypothetical protein CPLU01_12314 [Colletotrichum plurivorum]|uniref:Uncharacterized protein n=1 Tax=Colletotrichum plurivorum TaxID=2175906 RepID=A0A8H6K041_9PEZI|nr:hypothetical protein CPLU01_12314 [Colletotrichum plurivorum]
MVDCGLLTIQKRGDTIMGSGRDLVQDQEANPVALGRETKTASVTSAVAHGKCRTGPRVIGLGAASATRRHRRYEPESSHGNSGADRLRLRLDAEARTQA